MLHPVKSLFLRKETSGNNDVKGLPVRRAVVVKEAPAGMINSLGT